MSKDEVRREHANALRELIVYGMAGIKLTKEMRRREVLARAACGGDCNCALSIRNVVKK